MVRFGLLVLFLLGLLVNNCSAWGGYYGYPGWYRGGNGTCVDEMSEDACKAILDNDKCDKPPGMKCKKTCDRCDDDHDHGDECKDDLSEDKCKAILDAGKCDKAPGSKCKETCDRCDDDNGGDGKCKDKSPKCNKWKDKCDDSKIEKKCPKTCDACDDEGGPDSGEGECKDEMSEDKCKAILDGGKCDKAPGKKCKVTCDRCDDDNGGEGECKDELSKNKCNKYKKQGKCDKFGKKCMKTCDMCEDEPKKSAFELIDEDADDKIDRAEWDKKIELVMDKVMSITNVSLSEDLYDDIWEAINCNNDTTIDTDAWEMLLDGKNQCGEELDNWFHFAFNVVVSLIQIVYQ